MGKAPIRVLTWPDYAVQGVATLFTSTTGMEVEWNSFDQNEEAFLRCTSDRERYDVIFADGLWPKRYLASGLIQPVAADAFDGWRDVHPVISRWCSVEWTVAAREVLAFPCYWGVRGMLYDPQTTPRPDSWSSLAEVQPGRLWLNSQGSEVMAEVALGMGIEKSRVYEMTAGELEHVGDRLLELVPRIGGVWRLAPEIVAAFRAEASLAEVHSTVLIDNIERAATRRLAVAVPEEGTVAYVDGAMLGAGCRCPDEALEFIRAFSSPAGVEAQWRESDGYPCANALGFERLWKEPGFRSKLERSGATFDSLARAVMYRPPSDMDGYRGIWRSFLERLTVPIPRSVRESVGLEA